MIIKYRILKITHPWEEDRYLIQKRVKLFKIGTKLWAYLTKKQSWSIFKWFAEVYDTHTEAKKALENKVKKEYESLHN